ncbi:uncharacterized protein METZ01_LOCUS320570, partial [marine metagenome]
MMRAFLHGINLLSAILKKEGHESR